MHKLARFELERYFAQHEFSVQYLLSSSDCEPLSLRELLALADPEACRLWEDLRLGYTESPGHPLMREAIASMYDGIAAEDVLGVVPEEGIFLLMHALLEAGDHVVCTFPAYQSLYEVAQHIGCQVSRWEPDEEYGWRFDLDKLIGMLRPGTRLVVVNFPHNPTGQVPPPAEFAALVDLVRERGIHLLSDEMYRFLEVDPAATLPAVCETYQRAYSLSGLSKAFGLPGLRAGWIATTNHEVLARVAALKDYTTICASAPSEILALIALRNRGTILAQQRERLQRNLAVLDDFFAQHADCFRWNRPTGGSICFPRLLLLQGADAFCQALIQEAGIMLVPSRVFGFGDAHVRVGFGRENLPEVIHHLAGYLSRKR